MTFIIAIQATLLTAIVFTILIFLYQILFYGFTPILATRPDEIKKIIKEVRIKDGSIVYSLGGGSSGFLNILSEHYPNINLVGVEDNFFLYLAAKLQSFIRKSRVNVVRSEYYWANIRKADVIYLHLELKEIREIQRKLKIDTKPDALIVSNGFVIPYMDYFKVVELKEKKRWFSFLNRGKKVVRTSLDEAKRDNKVYFYQV